ncbi:MAG TPA: AmmeMemoRadiSam system protein B [Candidatus Margulisiibacteriota bacterium]|nr:AmmeMemoRadiSam system protein B [Candidatus Margulisiibacteriota bacterium]
MPLRTREAVVAGQFYPASAQKLRAQIGSFVDKNTPKSPTLACILPHAGYIYSGRVAAETVSRIELKEKIILLGPNHTGEGEPFSIMTEGAWQTPLGDIRVDALLANKILNNSRNLAQDSLAHINEHSLEVELPILQYFKSDFTIVPIAFLSDDLMRLKAIGREIAGAVKDEFSANSMMLLASSDMTHYEPEKIAREKDGLAISAILELDEDKLMEVIRKIGITMCGYAPVIVMLSAAKALGAKKAQLVKYQTSAEETKDTASVVGYAGIIIN